MRQIFLWGSVIILVNLIIISCASMTGAVFWGDMTSKAITTYLEDPNPSVFEQSERIWEISPSSIDLGKTLDLKKGDLIKLIIWDEGYPIYINEISNAEIRLVTFGNQTIFLKQNESKTLEITDRHTDEKKILKLVLDSIEGETAQMYIKTYDENTFIQADYKELFDIEVELPNGKIYESSDLIAYIKFFNFGEGPSHINIEYAVLDDSGKEYYRGIDDKVVYTEDSIIKNFNFLKLPSGNYTITSEIFYGKNQTAFSEKNFRILPVSQFSKLEPFLILGGVIAALVIVIYQLRPRLKKKIDDRTMTLNAIRKNLT